MDDEVYARKAVRKLEVYESNGICIGERLIVTFETSEKILGTKEIERIVQRFCDFILEQFDEHIHMVLRKSCLRKLDVVRI